MKYIDSNQPTYRILSDSHVSWNGMDDEKSHENDENPMFWPNRHVGDLHDTGNHTELTNRQSHVAMGQKKPEVFGSYPPVSV